MKKELKEYYHRLIDMSASISGVDGEEMKSRLKIITPIYHDRFPVKNFLFLYFAILCNDYFNFFCFVFMGILSFPIVFITKNIFQFALYLNSKQSKIVKILKFKLNSSISYVELLFIFHSRRTIFVYQPS